MGKTFEALIKAEKQKIIDPEEIRALDLTLHPHPQPKPPVPVSFDIPPQIVEGYLKMKRTLLSTSPGKKIKTILFSSSTAGEGTSTVLFNFAITLASGGDTVLVVDANLRNPILHGLFNLEKKNGFTELVLGNRTLQEVIKGTRINNLSVITSGTPHPNPSSLFASKSLDTLTEQMKSHADWVLFDSPPINSYSDSSTFAEKIDGVVMVVHAEKTRWEEAQSAKEQIETGKVKILGTILNRRKMHIPDWAYKRL